MTRGEGIGDALWDVAQLVFVGSMSWWVYKVGVFPVFLNPFSLPTEMRLLYIGLVCCFILHCAVIVLLTIMFSLRRIGAIVRIFSPKQPEAGIDARKII